MIYINTVGGGPAQGLAQSLKLEELNDIPIKVVGVRFLGIERTKQDILEVAVERCLHVNTFGELTKALSSTSEQLSRLEIFKEMRFIIDRADKDGDQVIIRIEVKERKYKVHAGTEIQKNEVGFGAGGTFYNVFGRGEKLDINGAIGSQTATPLSMNVSKPLGGGVGDNDSHKVLNLSVFSTLQHYVNGANFKNHLQSISTSYSFTSKLGARHELKYILDWRHIFSIAEGASVTIRRNAGHDLKSSLLHVITRDGRDCPVLPVRGYFGRFSTELAGLGGSVSFLKNDISSSLHVPLYGKVALGFKARLGHVHPLAGQKLSILDKYQMGGPLSIRGFALNTLGPKDHNDAIGGNFLAEASLGVTFPLSGGTSQFLRGHLFTNAGVLANVNSASHFRHSFLSFFASPPNVSLGAGLQVKLGEVAKLEMNFTYPLIMQTGATFNRGLQIGLGVDFL